MNLTEQLSTFLKVDLEQKKRREQKFNDEFAAFCLIVAIQACNPHITQDFENKPIVYCVQ